MEYLKVTGDSTFVYHTTHPLFVAEVGKEIKIVWSEYCDDPIASPNPNEIEAMKEGVRKFLAS